MARTSYSAAKKEAPEQSKGLKGWLQSRKERKEAIAEQAARQIADDTAKNETTIIDTLQSVRFNKSLLPKEVLEYKSNPELPCGDYEYISKAVCNELLNNPQMIEVDLRKVDEKILQIALLFKQSVEQGDEHAAKASKDALYYAITEVRKRIPVNQPELFGQFVEVNATYLESWICQVHMAQEADVYGRNAEKLKKSLEEKEQRDQELTEQLKQDIWTDPEKAEALEEIMNHDTPEERAKWSAAAREVHKLLINRRLGQLNLWLDRELVIEAETLLETTEGRIDTLYSDLKQQRLVTDPNLLNKYKEEVNALFARMAEADTQIDEALRDLDDIEGRIDQINNAPGAVRAREVAAEQAAEAVEAIKAKQGNKQDVTGKHNNILAELGILTQAEEEQQNQQAAEEAVSSQETQYEEESERPLNYN